MEADNFKDDINCASCLNQIGSESYVSALGEDWHKDCFRCSVCDVLLSNWYFEKSGLLFCQNDYWTRFGECCQHCTQVITGPVMSAGAHRFHPECFACGACGAHIEDGEPYALIERSKLYCGGCYKKDACPTVGHSIRALTVPREVLTGDAVPPGDMDSSCGMLTLHIGDRILEINGTPVRNRPLHEIEKALACSDTLLQLTIEHDPETNTPHNLLIDEENPILSADIKPEIYTHSQTDIPRVKDNCDNIRKDVIIRKNTNEFRQEKENAIKIEIDTEENQRKKERLFKRKGDTGGKVRVIKRKQTPSSPLLGDKEKSSSMSKLLDVVDAGGRDNTGVLCDLSRARSFRTHHDACQKVFRACDLLQGELLGSGFFGEVYRVTHRDTGEVMVLKQLYRVDEDAQRNFLKEVAVLRSLTHPNVLRFIGVLYKDKRLHLVTEYVAGGTLQQLLQDTRVTLNWHERARLARDIAAGVGYLHRMNIIHRDLNSHNCLVREDKTVIVADFGLARIVQRTASSGPHNKSTSLRRKRYTVVGNPYWMAPEMMNGKVYDEKVDVFSFGIILCEIIGRVQADPDFLPRRNDFGLNEGQFLDKFCVGCPEPFYRVAFLTCHLDPDCRPPFEVTEIWLESIVMHLASSGPIPPNLLADILQYSQHDSQGRGHATPECCHPQAPVTLDCCQSQGQLASKCCQEQKSNIFCAVCSVSRSPSKHTVSVAEVMLPEYGVIKSKSNATMLQPDNLESNGRALGKCVSASHICQAQRPIVTITNISRSQNALTPTTPAGYILRADGKNINITKVDDITEWLDPPPPLKRTSPDSQLNNIAKEVKTRKVDETQDNDHVPAFLRNQSVEGLESQSKHDIDAPLPFCRHFSIPDNCEVQDDNSDSSDDDLTDMCDWYKNVSSFKKLEKMDVDQPKNILAGIVKKGENLLSKKSSYDVTEISNPVVKNKDEKDTEINIPKNFENQRIDKQVEKGNFFTKKLLSPKLSRLFKPNSTEVQRNKPELIDSKEEKSKSKFFIEHPVSPNNICRSYRVRPFEGANVHLNIDKSKVQNNLLKSDIKLANMGKPMTPIFRRHVSSDRNDFCEGRFSYRDRRHAKYEKSPEPKFLDIGRNKIKTPVTKMEIPKLSRSNQINNIPSLIEVKDKSIHSGVDNKVVKDFSTKKREPGISRSNYVSLANLKINSRNKDSKGKHSESAPLERVI